MIDESANPLASCTSVSALTPTGRGAIGVVSLRGPLATRMVERCFQRASGRSVSSVPSGSVLLGIWMPGDDNSQSLPVDTSSNDAARQAGEELIVTRLDSDAWEIHCHGGHAAVEAIVTSLEQQGCMRVPWQQVVSEAYATGEHARQAWQDLSFATTQRVARILLDQARGALDDAITEIQHALDAGEQERSRAITLLDTLLQRAEVGRCLLSPRRIVLAGRPNVGKSSLINALVGFDRTLVTPQAGTTRDLVGVATVIDGWPVEFIDTAGVRATSEPLEASGIARSLERWQQTDLRILVEDASISGATSESSLAESLLPPDLVVWNKIDLVTSLGTSESLGTSNGQCAVSAVTGQGIPELIQRLANRLAPPDLQTGVAIPWTEEQRAALRRWRSLV